jgi:esterase/lipase
MKKLRFLGIAIVVLVALYTVGPTPDIPKLSPKLPEIDVELINLDRYIANNESKFDIKPDNEARIVWANESKSKTKYSIVYLHGFSACQEEGNPVHRNIAKAIGANLYLSRLAFHGLNDVDAMKSFTVDKLWESAKEALAIGRLLGDSVILMGTSTGGTLNIIMASKYSFIKAIINYSPNIEINNPNAWLLNNPWGLNIARLVVGSKYVEIKDETEDFKKYWYTRYRLEGAVELQQLIEYTMQERTFSLVKTPTLNLYYYKDEENQDRIVKVSAIQKMHQQLGTEDSKKRLVAIPNAGDHVLASPIKSKDIASTEAETKKFITDVLSIPIIDDK